MMLLEAQHIKYMIKDRLLFDIEQLEVHKGDRIGLVGPNGVGKTALLNILSQQTEPDAGHVELASTYKMIPQLKTSAVPRSGGEITQQYIKKALLKHPALLFADEPTTHLDTSHIEWLERELTRSQDAYVIASHDREFLDAVCTNIWEMQDGKVTEYKGNYTDYRQQKEIEQQQHETEYDTYLTKKRQLEQAIQQKERKAARATKKPKHISSSEARMKGAKPYFAKKQKKLQQNAKAIETRLEKLKKVEKPEESTPIKMNIPHEQLIADKPIIKADDLQVKVDQHILINTCRFTIFGGDKVALIGNNGSGKTTLIKDILRPDSTITVSPSVKIGYFSQNLDILDPNQTILDNVSVTSFHDETLMRIVLARLDFKRDDVYKQVHVLSGGERVKVALAKLFLSDVNTLILDEPTNFLDIQAVEALESLLKDYTGTIIFASHDRQFVQHIATRIFSIAAETLTTFDGNYETFKLASFETERDTLEDKKLLLETRMTEVLSLLSLEPTEALEKEFQELIKQKKQLDNN